MGVLVSRVRRVGTWVALQPTWLILGFLTLASLVRSGFVLWNWFFLSPQLVDSWTAPNNPFQSNVLFNALGYAWSQLAGPPEGPTWLITQLVLAGASVFVIGWLCLRATRKDIGLAGVAIVLASGVSAVLWREAGRYDFIFFVAIFVGLLAQNRGVRYVGLFVAAASAPEQALLAAISWVLLTFLPDFRQWLKTGLLFLGMSVLTASAVQAWFTFFGEPLATRFGLMYQLATGNLESAPSRFDPQQGFVNVIVQKFYEGLAPGPALLWSYLGSFTFLIVIVLLSQPRAAHMLWLLVAVIVFPLTTTLFFGEDPTRDLVIVGVPTLILILLRAAPLIYGVLARVPIDSQALLSWVAIAVTLMPTIYYFFSSEIAYDFLIHLLISWNNGTPIDWSGNTR